ncbi:diaminopimelate epimerase [Rhodobacteraceae bacterium WD3A24]|nr:diaminopimelate epimerase [Rhodobacteraceae bacterium WD3A24]
MERSAQAPPRAFMKMHGLGNDFVVFDARDGSGPVTPAVVRALGDRHRGVGFDQLAVIAAPAPGDSDADLALSFFNADGSVSGTCGNATRCVAAFEMARTGRHRLAIRTEGGLLAAEEAGGGIVRVNMGPPATDWRAIPLAEPVDTLSLPIEGEPVATGMGNPHCTFFVEDAEAVAPEEVGPRFETHPLFPERTNVEIVQILSPESIRLRIWERGTGVTLASGSCACAAAVAAARRGLTGTDVRVHVDGGALDISWREDGVWMAGPTAHVFDGVLTPQFLQEVGK